MSHVLVVCARRYNGHELWTALGVMKHRGHKTTLASTDYIIQDEISMKPHRIKNTIDDVDIKDFDALMIVSGNMQDTEAYWNDHRVLKFVADANKRFAPIAAICCSVPTVRYASNEKKVSFFPLVRSRWLLSGCGAILQDVALTRDCNLVTAEHQMASEMWAEEFCNLLEDKPTQYKLISSGYTPKGRERKPIPAVEEIRKRREKHEPEDV